MFPVNVVAYASVHLHQSVSLRIHVFQVVIFHMDHTLASIVARILSLYVRRKSCCFYRNALVLLQCNLLIWWWLLHKGGHINVIN